MNPLQHILVLAVRVYRWTLSPAKAFLFGPLGGCRFSPSCSEYALEAIQTHGALAGSWLAVKRVCRCHPWGDCGHDPVPGEKSEVQGLKSKTVNSQWSVVSGSRPGPCTADCQFPVTPHAMRLTHLHGP